MADEIDVEIANLATGFFGEDDQIRDPDENSKPARAVRAAWSRTRTFVRGKALWSCGRRRSRLSARTANSTYPILDPYTHAFPLPTGFAKLGKILEPSWVRDDYEILAGPGGREIHCADSGPLEILWGEDVKDPARWSVEFTETFAMRLAYHIADRLSGDKGRKQQAKDAYETALSEGRGSDARQQATVSHAETPWARSRRSSTEGAPNT